MKSVHCCVNIHTKWIPLTVVSIFIQNELLWLLSQYSHKMKSVDLCVNIHTKWITLSAVSIFTQNEFLWLLCQYLYKMKSFDCCANIHTKWNPLTVVSIFTQNEIRWLLFKSVDCCVNIHTKWIPFPFPASLRSSGRSHVDSLFTMEGRKSWLCVWYFYSIFRPCSWRHWHRQLGTKWPLSQSCFLDFQTSIFNKQEWNVVKKRMCVKFFISFQLTGQVACLPFSSPLKRAQEEKKNRKKKNKKKRTLQTAMPTLFQKLQTVTG